MEVLEEDAGFTHFVYCDDDIVLDPSVLENLYYWLRIFRDKNQWVASAMLWQEERTRQCCVGGRVDVFHVIPARGGLDVGEIESLLRNESCEPIGFAGWWLFCMPVDTIRAIGLPLPLFLKFDDVEYAGPHASADRFSQRIGVWHEAFEWKDPQLGAFYFDMRNGLVLRAVAPTCTLRLKIHLFRTILSCMRYGLATYRYRNVRLQQLAIAHFLKGPTVSFGSTPRTCSPSWRSTVIRACPEGPRTCMRPGPLPSRMSCPTRANPGCAAC